MPDKSMTLREAAIAPLRAGGPNHYQAPTEEILAKGFAASSSKTPASSLNAMIAVDIQSKDLDALLGSLYRLNGVRGSIIATAPFSKGTSEAAFATGAAPIIVIEGDKLIDLLIEHGIGVRKNRPVWVRSRVSKESTP